MHRISSATLLLAALVTGGAAASGEPDEPPLLLDEVIALVRTAHPSLAAARARIEASEAFARREGAWEDPMVGVDIMRESTTDPPDPSAFEWMVEQRLPLSGRNRLAAAAAEAESGVAPSRVQGKPYVEVTLERPAMARFGLRAEDVLMVVEAGLGGREAGVTIQGRERWPIQVRLGSHAADRRARRRRDDQQPRPHPGRDPGDFRHPARAGPAAGNRVGRGPRDRVTGPPRARARPLACVGPCADAAAGRRPRVFD